MADGSQIITRRAHGRSVTVAVGRGGRERFGSCLRRLGEPELAEGYLPILRTTYVDRHGARYTQESFAARIRATTSLVSFVKVTADARDARSSVRVRFTTSVRGMTRKNNRLRKNGRTYLLFSEGATWGRPSLKYSVPRGETRTVYVAWLHSPRGVDEVVLDDVTYEKARASVELYWERRLQEGARIHVPEKRVQDAMRNLLVQNLGLTWRYSVGNRYEQLSTPEGVDAARVLAHYGHLGVSRAILRTSLRKRPTSKKAKPIRRSTNWRMGSRMVGFAHYARLAGSDDELLRATPALRAYVLRMERQLRSGRPRLLDRERYSSDVSASVYGLHSQAVVWQGLRALSAAWREAGEDRLAAKAGRLSRRLERGLRSAIRRSQRRVGPGALFVPVALLDGERPYRSLTASREGSYWNLVMPYALASGLFEPHGTQARGIHRYLRRNGSRLLGRVRAGAYGLYGRQAHPKSGSSPVYGLNMARFLADNDQPGQLVLGLYGQLAAEMTPGTFVSGESVSIAPIRGDHHRSTYLPPNSGSNASFLETLRLMLVHEVANRRGVPRGLHLAYATPRRWLRPGGRIEVEGMLTSFGPLSYSIEAGAASAAVSVTVPGRGALSQLRIRLRLPGGKRVATVLRDGVRYGKVLDDGETIQLPAEPGELHLQARFR